MLLSIIVPCYNEELTVPLFYNETIKILDLIEKGAEKYSSWNIEGGKSEIIFVDDGSVDKTLDAVKKLAGEDPRVRYIAFSRNFGKEAAMLAGLREARGLAAAIMDADLQHPPSLVPRMLDAVLLEGYDCAGTKRTRTGDAPVRTFFTRLFYRLMAKLTDIDMADGAGDFRLMNRNYIDAILSLNERNRFSKGIFPWIGFKTKWFEFDNLERAAGETKWSFSKLFLYSLDGMIAFSSKLLSLASILGMVCFIAALGFILFIIIHRIGWGSTVDGWSSAICIALLCSGLQLFSIGILGQYIAKIYTEVKQRPHYLVREKN